MATLPANGPFVLSDQPSHTELLAKYFRGLGDPTRLRILRLLDDAGELAVGKLVTLLGLPQATVSTHLACLRWCGFVSTRRDDRFVIYALADSRVSELIGVGESLLGDNADHVGCCTTIDRQIAGG
ncbi:MAG: metalloregulator ArsR/SmtB family transcription factor [Actinomycetota bacterium]|nr:metalloregulator ArsR/SmtB family transcription factor [Actinomycetota bacterium]